MDYDREWAERQAVAKAWLEQQRRLAARTDGTPARIVNTENFNNGEMGMTLREQQNSTLAQAEAERAAIENDWQRGLITGEKATELLARADSLVSRARAAVAQQDCLPEHVVAQALHYARTEDVSFDAAVNAVRAW